MMPLSLKNVGVTFQRLVNKILKNQLERNTEAYVDNMLVKSPKASAHVKDLNETFSVLRKYKFKLPMKCVFGATSRKFIGSS